MLDLYLHLWDKWVVLRGSCMSLVPHELLVLFSAGASFLLFFQTGCYCMFCDNLVLIDGVGDFASMMLWLIWWVA